MTAPVYVGKTMCRRVMPAGERVSLYPVRLEQAGINRTPGLLWELLRDRWRPQRPLAGLRGVRTLQRSDHRELDDEVAHDRLHGGSDEQDDDDQDRVNVVHGGSLATAPSSNPAAPNFTVIHLGAILTMSEEEFEYRQARDKLIDSYLAAMYNVDPEAHNSEVTS